MFHTLTRNGKTWSTDGVTYAKVAVAGDRATEYAQAFGVAVTLERVERGWQILVPVRPQVEAKPQASADPHLGLSEAAVAKLDRTSLPAHYVAHSIAQRVAPEAPTEKKVVLSERVVRDRLANRQTSRRVTAVPTRNVLGRHDGVADAQPAFSTFDRYLDTPELTLQRELLQMAQAERAEEALEAQADRDAAYYGRSYRKKQTVDFTDRTKAVAMARRVKGSLKANGKGGWTVTFVGQVLVAREGDADYQAPEYEPGLLHGQREDAEDHGPCSCVRCSLPWED